MGQDPEETPPTYKAGLERARNAAAAHDLKEMLAELYACGSLDALHRHVQRKYPDLRDDEVAVVVGQVVDSFAEKAATGAQILNPGAYLMTTASWRALDLVEKRRRETLLDEDQWAQVADEVSTPDLDLIDPDRARQLYAAVYTIIPKIGGATVQAVVRHVVEAAEQGVSVTHAEIAEALGINPNSVGKSLQRGMQRLRSRMIDAGLVPQQAFFAPEYSEGTSFDSDLREDIDYAD